jgi:hypothetical protein
MRILCGACGMKAIKQDEGYTVEPAPGALEELTAYIVGKKKPCTD